MKLREYFEKATGMGVLATADSAGKANLAIYAKPYFLDEETVAFVMADRLSHHNLQSNEHAAYLFLESGKKFEGKRLYLAKTREEKDSKLIEKIIKEAYPEVAGQYQGLSKYLVYFHIEEVLPLLGERA